MGFLLFFLKDPYYNNEATGKKTDSKKAVEKKLKKVLHGSNTYANINEHLRKQVNRIWRVGETVNSHAFHACIHGFESRTRHHL